MRDKTSVLHVTGVLNRGGAEGLIVDLVNELNETIDFSFLVNYKKNSKVPNIGDYEPQITNMSLQIERIPTQWDIGPIKYIMEFNRIYNKLGRPSVVHIHLNSKSGLVALAAKLSGAKKIIVHSHGIIKYEFNSLYQSIYSLELFLQKAFINIFSTDKWSCSNQAIKSLFYREHDVKIINNAIDVKKYTAVPVHEVQCFKSLNLLDNNVVGFVGRVMPVKNLEFIIKVISELKKKIPTIKLIIVGRDDNFQYMSTLKVLIESLELENNVLFYGLSDNIPLVMNSIDVFVAPSLKEAFGMVALEAQAAGKKSLISTAFPKSVDVGLNLVEFLELDINIWVEELYQYLNEKEHVDSESIENKFKKCGYDVSHNSFLVNDYYNE